VKVCGVAVVMLRGYSRAPTSTIDQLVNTGTVPVLPRAAYPSWISGLGPLSADRDDAIAEIHFYATVGYRQVLDADIEACFDSIDHTALMGRVRDRVKDKRVLALVKAFLKAGVMTETGVPENSETGTRRGECRTFGVTPDHGSDTCD
jgi:hypothetical protein